MCVDLHVEMSFEYYNTYIQILFFWGGGFKCLSPNRYNEAKKKKKNHVYFTYLRRIWIYLKATNSIFVRLWIEQKGFLAHKLEQK